jgi:DNA-binding phage protein
LYACRSVGRVGGRPGASAVNRSTRIARELGVGRSTLYRALENHDPDSATG